MECEECGTDLPTVPVCLDILLPALIIVLGGSATIVSIAYCDSRKHNPRKVSGCHPVLLEYLCGITFSRLHGAERFDSQH